MTNKQPMVCLFVAALAILAFFNSCSTVEMECVTYNNGKTECKERRQERRYRS